MEKGVERHREWGREGRENREGTGGRGEREVEERGKQGG